MTTPREVVDTLLADRPRGFPSADAVADAYAPANIALVKYWGKRNESLHLPVTSSLSLSLGSLGSRVRLSRADAPADRIFLNGQPLSSDSAFARRASAWLDLFRPAPLPDFAFELRAINTIPTAAGFASSASGFAALAKAVDELFAWRLPLREQSILARLGSGSAARSLFHGFVLWQAGRQPDGMDSVAEPIPETWPALRMAACVLCDAPKPLGSGAAMKRSVETCPFYSQWPALVERDLAGLQSAIHAHDLPRLGEIAESNALAMHSLMMATRPPILYALPQTLTAIHTVCQARQQGIPVWFTMDAGPNLKLLFEASSEPDVRALFPEMNAIAPFAPFEPPPAP